MKAWLVYSDGSATNNTIVRCRNKLAEMRTFGITESDFSNCVEFCELHVDSSGCTFEINDMSESDSLLEVHADILQDLKETSNETAFQPRYSVKTAKAVSQPLPPQQQHRQPRRQLGSQQRRQHHQQAPEGLMGFLSV